MSEIQPKKVTILSGFLGAGKTTFLNQLIKAEKGKKPIVIENEFGQEGIDGKLVVGAEGNIFEMSNGCLCCSLNDDLINLLEGLWKKKDQFDDLIIETTGIADPASVALPFLSDDNLARFYKLERVICLVDAKLVEKELENTTEARKQIAFSDILLINKSDTVGKEELEKVRELLAHINPTATVFVGNSRDGYPIDDILKLNRENIDNMTIVTTAEELEHEHHHHHEEEAQEHHHHEDGEHHHHDTEHHHHDEHCGCGHDHEHDHEHHHHDIVSLSYTYENDVFDPETFQGSLLELLNAYTDSIYRVKGIVNVPDSEHKIIVQSVSNLLSLTEGDLWKEGEPRVSKIVFIGKHLKKEGFKQLLDACLMENAAK